MVNNNNGIPIEVNKKPIEIVYELKEQDNYQSNWLAKTFLSNVHCAGESKNKRKVERGGQHLISTLNRWGKKSEWWNVDKSVDEEDDWHSFNFKTSAEASAGVGGAIVGGSASGSLVKYGDEDINVGFGGISLGGEAGIGLGGATLGYSANLDVANLHTKQGIRANVGIDGGSNFTAGSGGVEVKAVGFGLSVGKKMGISTPLGGISIDFEETCNQQ